LLIPERRRYGGYLVIRTDFSNDLAWEHICSEILQTHDDDYCYAEVECVSEKACDGLEPEELRGFVPKNYRLSYAFIVDKITVRNSDHPVLVFDYLSVPARSFRVIPFEVWCVESNLSLANLDFETFLESCGKDRVFRGFPD
jgi:hypothetical protein